MSATELKTNLGEQWPHWRVLLMYEDLSTGLRAKEAFDHAMRQCQEQADSQFTLWKFDLLQQPELRNKAAHEAEEADIVLVSAHGQAELPTAVKASLAESFGLSRDHPKALVVSLKGIQAKSTGQEAKPLVIDQKGCEYSPYVSACQTGQEIVVRNSDPVLHNVHVTPKKRGNKEQNRAQLPLGPDLAFRFNAPEDFLRFKCDVHAWMFAYVSVFDNPYFSVSDTKGSYRIHNVPPGIYTAVAIHHKAGTLKRKIEVKDQDVELDFTFEPKPAR